MGSLTSSLIISLIDKVTGPAKSVASSLKNLAAAEKSAVTAAGKSAATTTQGVNNLAKSLSKANVASVSFSKGFADQLGTMNLTQRQVERLRGTFEKYQRTLSASGVKMHEALPKLDTWEKNTIGSLRRAAKEHEKHSKRFSRLRDVNESAIGAAAPYVGAYAVGKGGKMAVEKTAELQREKVRESLAGLSEQDRASIIGKARQLSAKYPSVGQTDIMERQRQLYGTLGDLHHAQDMVEEMVKAQVVLSSGAGGHEGAVRDLDQIVKAEEGAGYASSPEKFSRMLTAFVKAKNLFGETLTGEDFRTYLQRSKTSKLGLSEDYLATVAPTMIQHEGANQFGTAQATAFNALLGKRQTKASQAKLRKFGLLDDNNDLLDKGMFSSDPYEWAKKHLAPRMEKAGMSLDTDAGTEERGKAVDFLMQGFSNRNTGEFFASLLANRKVIEKDRANLKNAKGPDAAKDVIKQDPFQGWEAVKQQTSNLAQNILENGLIIQNGLNAVASGIATLAKALGDLPEGWRTGAATTVEGVAAAAGIYGLSKVGAKGIRWLRGAGSAAGAMEGAVAGVEAGTAATAASSAAATGAGAAAGASAPWWATGAAAYAPHAVAAAALAAAPLVMRKMVDDAGYAGKTSGERMAEQRGGSLTDARRRAFNEERAWLGLPLAGEGGGQAAGSDDVWTKGTDAIQHLDMSAQAGAAGTATGNAYKTSVEQSLAAVDPIIQAAVQRWTSMLNFNASPTITPSISSPSAPSGTPGKGAALNSLTAKHAAFADIGFDTA